MPLPAPTGSYGTLAPAIREDRSTRGLSQEGRGVSVLADGAGRAARGARGLRTVRCRPPALGLGLAAAVSRSHAGSRPDAGRRRRTPSGAPQRPGRAAAAAGWSVSAAPAPPPGYLLPTASPALPISLPLRVARPVRRRARLQLRPHSQLRRLRLGCSAAPATAGAENSARRARQAGAAGAAEPKPERRSRPAGRSRSRLGAEGGSGAENARRSGRQLRTRSAPGFPSSSLGAQPTGGSTLATCRVTTRHTRADQRSIRERSTKP